MTSVPAENKGRQLSFCLVLCVLFGLAILSVMACARYQLDNDVVTTSRLPDGTEVIETAKCKLTVTSMREVRDADIKLSNDCALTGGANALGANERAIEMIREIVEAVP